MINTKPNTHVYFALDSDVLSNLATIYKLQSNNPNASPKEIKDTLLNNPKLKNVYNNFKFYTTIISMAKSDKIRLLVTPTPFYESRHMDGIMQFIEDFCYLPNVKEETASENAKKIRELAQAYCHPYYNKNGEKCKAPMNPKYDAHAEYTLGEAKPFKGFLVPPNDAYVLAEASFYGACLITENAKDFLFNKYNQEKQTYNNYDNDRVKGIVEINQKLGYFQPNTTKFFNSKGNIVPRPYSVEGIGKILAYHEETAVFSTSNDSNFSLAFDEINL